MSSVNDDQGSVQKAENARFPWSIRHGIVTILALCSFIALFLGVLYEQHLGTATMAFCIATFAGTRMIPLIEGKGTGDQIRWPDWSLVTYSLIYGLGGNWICAFLWFSRRYAFFSAPVVGVTVLIMASYGAIALFIVLLDLLFEGNWRRSLLVFSLVPGLVAIVILRLRLLE
jgi:hypothetical protein